MIRSIAGFTCDDYGGLHARLKKEMSSGGINLDCIACGGCDNLHTCRYPNISKFQYMRSFHGLWGSDFGYLSGQHSRGHFHNESHYYTSMHYKNN